MKCQAFEMRHPEVDIGLGLMLNDRFKRDDLQWMGGWMEEDISLSLLLESECDQQSSRVAL